MPCIWLVLEIGWRSRERVSLGEGDEKKSFTHEYKYAVCFQRGHLRLTWKTDWRWHWAVRGRWILASSAVRLQGPSRLRGRRQWAASGNLSGHLTEFRVCYGWVQRVWRPDDRYEVGGAHHAGHCKSRSVIFILRAVESLYLQMQESDKIRCAILKGHS